MYLLSMSILDSVVSETAEFLFPGGCILCGAALLGNSDPFYPVCRSCVEKVEACRIAGRRCRVCGTVITSEDGVCLRCREREYTFDGHYSPFMYSGDIQTLLSAYKTRGCRSVARVFAATVAAVCEERYPGIPVVPVPSRPSALRKRGFSNTGLICRRLRADHGIVVLDLLRRAEGKQQKSLNYHQRFENMRDKISRRRPPPEGLHRLVLFDDVFTSGATADACARVLKDAGIQRVDILTIAQD